MKRKVIKPKEPFQFNRRDFLKATGLGGIGASLVSFLSSCTQFQDDVLSALCDTFFPGEDKDPGGGPGALDGGMTYYMVDIMGRGNVDLVVQGVTLYCLLYGYGLFQNLGYERRVQVMEKIRKDPLFSDLFFGVQEATAFAFYSELLGEGPSPIGDPAFPGTYALIGFPKFSEGFSEDFLACIEL